MNDSVMHGYNPSPYHHHHHPHLQFPSHPHTTLHHPHAHPYSHHHPNHPPPPPPPPHQAHPPAIYSGMSFGGFSPLSTSSTSSSTSSLSSSSPDSSSLPSPLMYCGGEDVLGVGSDQDGPGVGSGGLGKMRRKKRKGQHQQVVQRQTKTFVRAICVMSPVLGLTWVFGVMGVSEETMVFQVLFVLFNSLQGLLIFVFHCLLAKAVRDGLLMKSKNYRLSKLSTTSANKSVFDKYKYSQDSTSSINSELTSSSGAGLPDKTKAVSRQKQNILPSSGSFFRSRPDPYTQPYYFNCSTL